MKPNAQKTRRPGIDQWPGKNAHSLLSRIITTWTAGSLGVLFLLFCILAAVSTAPMTSPTVQASSPNSGTITLGSAPITWQGTATAGGALGDPLLGLVTSEDMCVEGTSCDTYTLTIGGTPSRLDQRQKARSCSSRLDRTHSGL